MSIHSILIHFRVAVAYPVFYFELKVQTIEPPCFYIIIVHKTDNLCMGCIQSTDISECQ